MISLVAAVVHLFMYIPYACITSRLLRLSRIFLSFSGCSGISPGPLIAVKCATSYMRVWTLNQFDCSCSSRNRRKPLETANFNWPT